MAHLTCVLRRLNNQCAQRNVQLAYPTCRAGQPGPGLNGLLFVGLGYFIKQKF